MDFVSGSKVKINISVNIIFKNRYMLISEYIFVIFLSLFVISFRGMGVGREGKAAPGF